MHKTVIALALALSIPSASFAAARQGSSGEHVHKAAAPAPAAASKLSATNAALRDLWLGHVFWVRNVVTASLAKDDAARASAETQVVANARAIAATIEPFYGAAAKDKLFELLAGHYGAVKAYLDASIAKNASAQSEATTKLTANAKEIAAFLASANPNLPADTVEELLQAHGGHHIAEIQELQAHDYAAEAKTWADMTQHMYVIADAIGGALAKQFPDKFAAR
mgnify:CR=1 FL=1